jgi:type II secretory pathway component PulF
MDATHLHVMSTDFVFAYRALRADGAEEQGTLDVESTAAATVVLTSRGLLPLEVRVARVIRQPMRVRSDRLTAALVVILLIIVSAIVWLHQSQS